MVGDMAQRLAGLARSVRRPRADGLDQLHHRHDGFTLNDLVSYNDKHNEANGEGNRDGANDNNSWNCGWEGPTDDPGINALRRRQMKNAVAMLLVSQGVPMILMGDEVARTQMGNNNAYCHDNELVWLDWARLQKNADLFRFFQEPDRLPARASGLSQPLAPQRPGLGRQRLPGHLLARHASLAAGLVGRRPHPRLHALRERTRAAVRRRTTSSTWR